MLNKLFGLFKTKQTPQSQAQLCEDAAPEWIKINGVEPLHFSKLLINKTPAIIDWQKVYHWIDHIVPENLQAHAWLQCEQAWLLHLRDSLGSNYELIEDEQTFVLSSLERRQATLAMEFIGRARKRILHTLNGIAHDEGWGKDILVICADIDDYFTYIAAHYPDNGKEIARSSGIYLHTGCGHFVTMDTNLTYMEPVIVHELTHAYLLHLPIPLWLNEGIAVNVEHRLTGRYPAEMNALEMYEKHQQHWTAKTIQTFWSGEAFQTQETMTQAYDLATTMVTQLAKDWPAFTQLALTAHHDDAGSQAMQQCMEIKPGEYISLMLDKTYHSQWEPHSTMSYAQ